METKRIDALQGLRGFAAVMIFLSHCRFLICVDGINRLNYLGAGGVSVFLYLSGFLAAYTVNYKSDDKNFIKTIIGKGVKFYPLHVLTFLLALPLCIESLLSYGKEGIATIFGNLLLVQAWIPISKVYFSVNDVSWYLSLFCFLIIVSPWLTKRINRLQAKTSVYLLFVIFFLETTLFIVTERLNIGTSFKHWILYVCPLTRMLDFCGGCLVFNILGSKLVRNNRRMITNIGMILLLVNMICCAFIPSEFFSTAAWSIPSSMIFLGITCFEINEDSSSSTFIRALFNNNALSWIGSISLEFFMIHKLVLRYGTEFLHISMNVSIFYRVVFYLGCFIMTSIISFALNKLNHSLTITVRSRL